MSASPKEIEEKVKKRKHNQFDSGFWNFENWDDHNPPISVIEYPDKGELHFTFFKSACKEHLFSMTRTGKIYEVCKDKKDKFKLMRVL